MIQIYGNQDDYGFERDTPGDKFWKNVANDMGKILFKRSVEYIIDKAKENYPTLKERFQNFREKARNWLQKREW